LATRFRSRSAEPLGLRIELASTISEADCAAAARGVDPIPWYAKNGTTRTQPLPSLGDLPEPTEAGVMNITAKGITAGPADIPRGYEIVSEPFGDRTAFQIAFVVSHLV
jgi:hypothetical protein